MYVYNKTGAGALYIYVFDCFGVFNYTHTLVVYLSYK